MSTKSSYFYGQFGHVYLDQGDGLVYWDSPRRAFNIRLPFNGFCKVLFTRVACRRLGRLERYRC